MGKKYLMKSMMQKGSAAVRKNSCGRCMLRYDVMLVNLVEPASAASVLTDAKDADIPVILFNREIDEKDLKISKNVW